MGNIFGIQKTPEQSVRGNKQMALGSLSGAVAGAQFGNSIGGTPGAIAGGVIGGVGSYMQQNRLKRAEKINLSNAKANNATVNNLEGRAPRVNSRYSNMARYGRKYEDGGQIEMEGDGSGDPNGIGEVHTDKNYNIKSMANGKPTHEEGGVPISESNLEKGDLIFPWQKDDDEYEKGMSMIKRFKTTGDPKAKKWLDDQVKTLPSDKDYGYGKGDDKKYPDGLINKEDGAWRYRKDPNTNKIEVQKKGTDKWIDLDSEMAKGNKGVDKDVVNSEIFNSFPKVNKKGIPNSDLKGVDELSTKDNPLGSSSDGVYGDLGITGSSFDKDGFAEFQTNPSEISNFNDQLDSERSPRMDKMKPNNFNDRYPGVNDISNVSKSMSSVPASGNNFIDNVGDVSVGDSETDGFQTTPIKNRTDITKYANVARNLYKGMDEPEVTTRRYMTPEELQYEDRSASQRSAIAEQRNAAQQSLRGKGLSAGQMTGYNRQIGANALRANEQVNEREAQRADAIAQQNQVNRANVNQQNLQLANQYDVQDLQNKASQQQYMNTAFSEVAQLGQINERQRYAVDRDNALMKNDMNTAKLMGTKHYNYSKSPYEVSFDPQFVPDYNKAVSKKRTITPNKRYGN